MKIAGAKQPSRETKMADARELCLSRLRAVPREKREAVADAILALADPDWWESRPKGADVFLLILEARQKEALKIIAAATS
jgi:hypothetical protein